MIDKLVRNFWGLVVRNFWKPLYKSMPRCSGTCLAYIIASTVFLLATRCMKTPYNARISKESCNRYADGEPRPCFRGYTHAFGVVLILVALLVLPTLLPSQTTSQISRLLLLGGFLCGKLVSYTASTILHRSAWTGHSASAHKRAVQFDYMAVNVSIFATAIPTAVHHVAVLYGSMVTLMAIAILLALLEWESSRLAVTLVQFVWAVVFIGYTTYWNRIWIMGSMAYAAAFACFGPIAAREGKGAELKDAVLPVPWHKRGRNGCHEDFHNLLFVADALYFANAIVHGTNCR